MAETWKCDGYAELLRNQLLMPPVQLFKSSAGEREGAAGRAYSSGSKSENAPFSQ